MRTTRLYPVVKDDPLSLTKFRLAVDWPDKCPTQVHALAQLVLNLKALIENRKGIIALLFVNLIDF